MPTIPTVYAFDDADDADYHDPRRGPTSALVGLALLPFVLPLAWLIGPEVTGHDPIFTPAVPMAVAVGMSGLGLGVVFTRDWTHAGRVRGVLALTAVAYAAGAFLFFLPKDWVETFRKRLGRGGPEWREFTPPDFAYRVRVPGWGKPAEVASPLPGWALTAFQQSDRPRTDDTYVTAHGPVPAAAAKDDDAFYAAVRKLVAQAAGVEPTEKAVVQQGHDGREFAAALPDNITNRTVRVFRVRGVVYYLAADGAALPADAKDVRRFFDSFYVPVRK